MSKRNYVVVAVAAAALLVVGGLFASNMGFKLNYVMDGVGDNGSESGTQSLALPFNQQTSLVYASDLWDDIEAAVPDSVSSIARFVQSTDGLQGYTGISPLDDYMLVPGEGYRVQLSSSVNYIIVGSHDPGMMVSLDGPGTNSSASGTSDYAYPYHSTAALASELREELNLVAGSSAVVSISKFLRTSDSLKGYTGISPLDDFPLVPGESYRIQVNTDVNFMPEHY